MPLTPTAKAPGLIKLSWLVRLHWVAIVGQTALVVGVHVWVVPLPLLALLALVVLEAAVNLALGAWLARAESVSDAALAAVMLFDSLVLAAMLHLSGGHFNPFSTLFLVNVALAAILLPPRWSWAQLAFSLAAFGALFPLQELAPFGVQEHEAMMTLHLQGMWVALALAAVLIVTIVQRVTRALSAREAELERARSLGERREKLASLATLAAGAAHELATPLGTIAVAAKELERSLQKSGATQAELEDLALIRSQVVRCRDILQQMAAQAGENAGEPLVPVPAAEWIASALDGLPERERVEAPAGPPCAVRGPPRGLARALKVLLHNALEASPPDRPVQVTAVASGREVLVEVVDRGTGMAPEVLARAGEPFFSTKGPGAGSGLGLFLARALVEQLGGRLTLESAPGRGTTARIALPAAEARP
ncbi:MAG TPA: ATP-binding protein [Anaeromyxobacteraceae bacterium]|nr:ATP-binding protein [Anaeromyxobacteraceae bacterium]